MLTLLELLLPEVAAHHRVAVLDNAVGEVLAGHAEHATLPSLHLSVVNEIPFLHGASVAVRQYWPRSTVFCNGSAEELALESQLVTIPLGGDHNVVTQVRQLVFGEETLSLWN